MACAEAPVEAPPPSKEEALALVESAPAAPPPPPAPEPSDALVPIEITWEGVGPYYQGLFQDQAKLTALSEGLAPWLNGPVQLFIRYDSENFIGHILVRVPPDALRAPVRLTEASVMLSDLSPITTALATYRNDLAGAYDVRIQSFVVGLDFYRGPVHCRVVPAGEPPPDGTRVSPCPLINGAEVCGTASADGVRFDTDTVGKLTRCLEG